MRLLDLDSRSLPYRYNAADAIDQHVLQTTIDFISHSMKPVLESDRVY